MPGGVEVKSQREKIKFRHNVSVSTSPFTVGIIQDHAGADVKANVARAERLVRDAARRGAQIICLKELFNSLYFCKTQQCERFDLAEPIPGPTTDAMQALARELAVVIVVPIFERQTAGIYRNSAAVIDADGTHALVLPCRRVLGGWMNARSKALLAPLLPTHWRQWGAR